MWAWVAGMQREKGTVVLSRPTADMRTRPQHALLGRLGPGEVAPLVPVGQQPYLSIAWKGAGIVLSCAQRTMASGNCTRGADCTPNSRVGNKRNPSLRSVEEVGATRTDSGVQMGSWNYKLAKCTS